MQTEVRLELPDDETLIKAFCNYVDDNLEEVAREVAEEAKRHITNRTRNLVKSIRVKKSRYENGGWIVTVSAPHAHLVEFGHDLVRNGRVVGRVRAHPFLRPALYTVGRRIAGRLNRANH